VLNNRFGPQGEIQSRSCLDLLGCGDCGYDGCPEKDLVQEWEAFYLFIAEYFAT